MGFSRTYDKRALSSLLDRVMSIDGLEIATGFFPEDTYGPENDNLPVADVAWLNERGFGTMIPSRPFMETTFRDRNNIQFFAGRMTEVFKDVLDKGRLTKRKLDELGSYTTRTLQSTIKEWHTPRNSARWAAIKGFDDPLVFTGKMLNSVKYKIEGNHA